MNSVENCSMDIIYSNSPDCFKHEGMMDQYTKAVFKQTLHVC